MTSVSQAAHIQNDTATLRHLHDVATERMKRTTVKSFKRNISYCVAEYRGYVQIWRSLQIQYH